MSRRASLPQFLSVGVILLLTGYIATNGYVTNFPSHERSSQRFDSAEWKKHKSGDTTYRWCAVDDLLARHQLTGMTRQEVIELLGEPTGYLASSPNLDYVLAPQPLIDSWWLIVDVDESGVVTDVYETGD